MKDSKSAVNQASIPDADFRLLLETVPGRVIILLPDDPTFTVVAVSNAYLAAVHKTREELIGRGLFETFPEGPDQKHTQTIQNLRASLRKVIATGQPDTLAAAQQYDLPEPSAGERTSTERHWLLVTCPVLASDNSVRFISHQVEDVTERVRAERSQRENETRQAFLLALSDAIRALRDPIAVKEAASRVVGEQLRVNRAFYADVQGDDWVIESLYERGVTPLKLGRYPAQTYGPRIMATYRAGERIVFRDTHTDAGFTPDERKAHLAIGIVSAVGVPLLKEGKLVAILAVHCAEPRNWTNGEIALIEETADRTWAAVQRARAEAAERASEGRYRLLFDSIDEGFCIIQILLGSQGRPADYRFIETNPMFERQTGLVNAVGRTALELVPTLEPFWFETYGRVALTGEPTRFVSHSQPMGRSFDVYAFRVGEPHDLRVALLFHDITAHERARIAIEESESRFRHLADHAPVMVWVTEPDGSCTFLSQSWYEFTGQTAETGLGFGWLDVIHPEDRPAAEQAFRDANANCGNFRVEYRLRRHDGTYRWAIDAATPRLGPGGEFLGYVGSVLDITDRKEAEEALRTSEAQFRVLTESLPQLVWSCLPDGRCDYLSRQWVAYTGIAASEQLDLRWLDRVIHPDDRERTLEHWLGAVAGRHEYVIELRIRGADGEYRWFRGRAVPLRDDGGQAVKWFGTCTDIDDLKRAEEALRNANLELEEFAYVASHDLQEPLRMVNIYTELLIKRHAGDNPQAQQYATAIHQGVRRMETLIRDLLTFSRTIHSDNADKDKADLSIALREATTVLKGRIDESGASIIAPELPVVRGDTAKLAQVFQNLLSNALKYQSNGGTRPEIRITAHCDGANWTIAVQDNGIGFEPQYAERIFGLFKRLHKEEYSGTGLGLAICRRIIDRHGGRIWADSVPGKGSTFYFSLPAAVSA
ncbi:MAG TPA: PAS domain S-box protein [Bryobacteraceae bacterium]|nr:PAS domain S-box protein [Bryobacteraceae bacterium]